jgi:hypothetical protein
MTFKRWQTAAEVKAHRKAQAKYQQSDEQVQKRENRNKARLTMEREGKLHKGDGLDAGHVDGHALNNDPTNWAVENRHKNRSYKRTKGAHKQDPSS